VGKAKAKALLSHFGGLAAVRAASEEALASAPGVGPVLAGEIYRYFHKKEEGRA
jgi:excinuclease ABC subunit C